MDEPMAGRCLVAQAHLRPLAGADEFQGVLHQVLQQQAQQRGITPDHRHRADVDLPTGALQCGGQVVAHLLRQQAGVDIAELHPVLVHPHIAQQVVEQLADARSALVDELQVALRFGGPAGGVVGGQQDELRTRLANVRGGGDDDYSFTPKPPVKADQGLAAKQGTRKIDR